MSDWDVIVVGVGAMGSATAFHLAQRGVRVLALEQFDLAHDQGSSHGYTRIMRHAYYNAPGYVPLVQRAQTLWRELEEISGETLFIHSGGLSMGRPDALVVRGALLAAERFGLAHEVLDASEVQHRYPAIRLSEDMIGVHDPSAGFLLPERAILAHAAAARSHGAEVRTQEAITGWKATTDGVEVQTEHGAYRAERLVFTAGAWMAELLADLNLPLEVTRQVVGWFEPDDPAICEPDRLPVWLLQPPGDEEYFYGLPRYGPPGLKLGRMFHLQTAVTPAELTRTTDDADESLLRTCLAPYFPGANGRALELMTCMFTSTPDGHFIMDAHPRHPNVTLVSACSGHGFKFASVVGEIAAELALDGKSRHDIEMFRLDRFENGTPQ
ncbi:MAG: N-methyl-L-tryptophan oxidase [Chloroflexi bacterium]|nr:N-methyl-L-tryptophan oxidase [Chloroflexota bacterium]